MAAGLGILGGIGGAFVGGWVANQGQERRFERERAAAIQDLRIDAYGAVLESGQKVVLDFQSEASDAEQKAALAALFAAEARVALIGGTPEVRLWAQKVREALTEPASTPIEQQIADYVQAVNTFLRVSREEIANSQE